MRPEHGGGGNRSTVSTYVLEEPPLADIKAFITAALHAYFDETVKPANDVNLKITQSWVNITLPQQYHQKHTHPNSLVSGVFYVSAQRDQDRLFFVKDAYERLLIPAREFNMFSSNLWTIPVGTGDLLLFPSNLPHMVEPTISMQNRISLSFNTFPVGLLGDHKMLAGVTVGTVK